MTASIVSPPRGRQLAGVVMSLLIVAGAGGARAMAVRRHHTPPRSEPSETAVRLRVEIDDLRAEVRNLESRLDAQARAQQQTVAVQTAQVQALAARAQASQAATQITEARIQTIPAQIAADIKTATARKGWEANTKVGGVMFADISHITNKKDGAPQPNTGTDYDIKRFYLIIDHRFNDVWSANFTSDFTYDSGPVAATQIFIKKAYVQAKFSDAFAVKFGSAELPWVPFVESVNGYRYVENMFVDRTKFGTTTDWGVHVFGTLANGLVSYAGSAIDGSGFRRPAIGTANRTGWIDLEGRVSANYHHVTAAVGGYSGKLGKAVTGTPTYNKAERFDALLAYTDSRIRIGGEYLWTRDWNDVTQIDPTKTNTTTGYSAFASYAFGKRYSVFGRYDWLNPTDHTAPSAIDRYFNLGVAWRAVDGVDLALVYKRDKADNLVFTSSNGAVGGVKTGTYDEIGMFTQVKF